ncbi:hypothetical protein KM043_000444 [Ampulex compressa]|nr:hypothetical protein KM043_000444 [Ampulex compressa]
MYEERPGIADGGTIGRALDFWQYGSSPYTRVAWLQPLRPSASSTRGPSAWLVETSSRRVPSEVASADRTAARAVRNERRSIGEAMRKGEEEEEEEEDGSGTNLAWPAAIVDGADAVRRSRKPRRLAPGLCSHRTRRKLGLPAVPRSFGRGASSIRARATSLPPREIPWRGPEEAPARSASVLARRSPDARMPAEALTDSKRRRA